MVKKQNESEILLRLPPPLCDDIKHLAKLHERSVNKELVWALRQYVAQEKVGQSNSRKVKESISE